MPPFLIKSYVKIRDSLTLYHHCGLMGNFIKQKASKILET